MMIIIKNKKLVLAQEELNSRANEIAQGKI
jgi:hypothetical protein